jgi:hypothetical protein
VSLRRALPGLLFALLVVGVYADPLFFRRSFAGRDLVVYQLPIEKAIHDGYSRGRLPVWISEVSGGRPLMANPNTGALFPVRPLLSVVEFPLAMRLFPVLHWIGAGVGTMLLLRSLGGSWPASWLAAATYVFSGVCVSEVFYSNNQPGTALLPWVVWAVARPAVSAFRRIPAAALLIGLDFLAGDVFTISMAIGCCVLWILLARAPGERIRELAALAGGILLACLLAAPQIVASLLWYPETNRAILGMKIEHAFQFSIHPARLLELIVPFPFGPSWTLELWTIWAPSVFDGRRIGFFSTLYAGGLAIIALAATWRLRSAPARFGRALLLLAIAVTVLPSLLREPLKTFPSPLPLRYPEKFAVALAFGCAVLAAVGFDRLRSDRKRLRWPIVVGGILTSLAVASALFPEEAGRLATRLVGSDVSFAPVASEQLSGALTEGALLWMVTVVALDLLGRSSASAIAASVILLTVVPIAANRKIARVVSSARVFDPSTLALYQQRVDPEGRYRTLGEVIYRNAIAPDIARVKAFPEGGADGWDNYKPALFGRGTVFNYDFDVGDFARVESLRKISKFAAGYADSQPFFRNLSLRWGIRPQGLEPIPGYEQIQRNGSQIWDELPGSLPDIRLVESWREVNGPSQAVAALPALRTGEIVIETGRDGSGTAAPGSVQILEKSPERVRIRVDAPQPTWLFVLRGFWNYRTLELDGRAAESVPAQVGFSAVAIPAGRHTIDWRERVPGLEVSRWGPLLFILFAVGLIARDRARRTRGLD